LRGEIPLQTRLRSLQDLFPLVFPVFLQHPYSQRCRRGFFFSQRFPPDFFLQILSPNDSPLQKQSFQPFMYPEPPGVAVPAKKRALGFLYGPPLAFFPLLVARCRPREIFPEVIGHPMLSFSSTLVPAKTRPPFTVMPKNRSSPPLIGRGHPSSPFHPSFKLFLFELVMDGGLGVCLLPLFS